MKSRQIRIFKTLLLWLVLPTATTLCLPVAQDGWTRICLKGVGMPEIKSIVLGSHLRDDDNILKFQGACAGLGLALAIGCWTKRRQKVERLRSQLAAVALVLGLLTSVAFSFWLYSAIKTRSEVNKMAGDTIAQYHEYKSRLQKTTGTSIGPLQTANYHSFSRTACGNVASLIGLAAAGIFSIWLGRIATCQKLDADDTNSQRDVKCQE